MSAANARVGALAGLLGGVVMAMWSMVALAATGPGFWTPVNLIAHTIWRGAPIDGGFSAGALLLGLMVHLAMSVVFGVILAALVGRLAGTLPALLAAGMAFGLAAWLLNQYVTWPVIDQTAAQAFTPWVLAVGHLLFGLVTAVLFGRLPAHRGLGRQLPV
jgi:uncharacterized membrane protein YagU involved in acid resistance